MDHQSLWIKWKVSSPLFLSLQSGTTSSVRYFRWALFYAYLTRLEPIDLFDEVFEILDSLSFFQKKISPCMWPLFEATYHSFKNGALDYFSGTSALPSGDPCKAEICSHAVEMFGCIDNFITFGHGTIAVNPEYQRMLIEMFTIVMTSPALGADDRVTACKLGEGILLHLRGQIDAVSIP